VNPDAELRLRLRDWRRLVDVAPGSDRAVIVEDLGHELAGTIERVILRRAVDEAVRRRADDWREWTGGESPDVRGVRARLREDAEAAHDRLRHTLQRMRVAQEEDVEPGAAVAVQLTGPDLAAGCAAVADLVGPRATLDAVLRSLRRVALDHEALRHSLGSGADTGQALEVARALAEYRWWPRSLRAGVFAIVATGRPVAEVLQCVNELAFTRLTVGQQKAALALMSDPEAPYGLDGTAIAAALLGIPLPARDATRPASRTRVFTAASARPSGASTRTVA
jgi:hypothetical protein